MTFAPPEGPLPELSTTRVGGGRSARLVAAAVASLLIGLVGYAFVNRAPAPVPVAVAPSGATSASPATPTPSLSRHQIEGNDGIFGWPVVAQLSSYRVPRGPGLFNRCRWDVGPQAARPLGTHDEASCPG